MRERIAQVLGWKVEDTYQFSLPTLRDLVRPVSPKLADELTRIIQLGAHIV